MKRIVNAFIAAVVVGSASLVEAHEVEVVLYPTIGPVSVPAFGIVSPSFGAFAANALFALQSGRRNTGGSILLTPTAFNTIGARISNRSGKVQASVYDMWATKGSSWRGFIPSYGPFANERGTHFRAAVAITSHSAFALKDVIISATYADAPGQVFSFPLGGPQGEGLYQSFGSNRLRGISWGPDGRAGGGDDTVYDVNNPGSYTTPVNQILSVGQGELGFSDPSDPTSDAEQFAAYRDYLRGFAPYTFSYTYGLRGVASTVSVEVNLTTRPGTGHHHRPPHRGVRPFRPFHDR